MAVLKRKPEKTDTVTIRVPVSVKAEIDRLRKAVAASEFDLNATLTAAVTDAVKAIAEAVRKQPQLGKALADGILDRNHN